MNTRTRRCPPPTDGVQTLSDRQSSPCGALPTPPWSASRRAAGGGGPRAPSRARPAPEHSIGARPRGVQRTRFHGTRERGRLSSCDCARPASRPRSLAPPASGSGSENHDALWFMQRVRIFGGAFEYNKLHSSKGARCRRAPAQPQLTYVAGSRSGVQATAGRRSSPLVPNLPESGNGSALSTYRNGSSN